MEQCVVVEALPNVGKEVLNCFWCFGGIQLYDQIATVSGQSDCRHSRIGSESCRSKVDVMLGAFCSGVEQLSYKSQRMIELRVESSVIVNVN
jgi:hypothetical protein